MRSLGQLVLVLALVSATLAGCARPTPDAPAATGIQGSASIGPTCPAHTTGDPACADRPYEGELQVETADGEVVETFRTGSDGRFHVKVAAGTYWIRSARETAPWCSSDREVVVVDGAYAEALVYCDSGIR